MLRFCYLQAFFYGLKHGYIICKIVSDLCLEALLILKVVTQVKPSLVRSNTKRALDETVTPHAKYHCATELSVASRKVVLRLFKNGNERKIRDVVYS